MTSPKTSAQEANRELECDKSCIGQRVKNRIKNRTRAFTGYTGGTLRFSRMPSRNLLGLLEDNVFVSCYHGNTRSWCGELLLRVVLRVRSHMWSRSDK